MGRKTLLVLGGSRYQVEAIRTGKRLGYRVITTDNIPANPGHTLSDRSYGIDTTDSEAILSLAKGEEVDGILAPCTDVAVVTAAYVAAALGLRGAPVKAAAIVTNKETFRTFLKQHDIPMPETYVITSSFCPSRELFERSTWIMKPDRSSGSKGVFIVSSPRDYHSHVAETLSYSPQGRGVLERFIDGFQGTCEGVLHQGRVAMSFFLDRKTVDPPYVATCGHHLPTLLPVADQKAVLSCIAKVWNLLGVTEGPFDCDFVVAPDRTYIIEMSPRMGGNLISALLLAASHFDIVEYSVRHACGDDVELPEKCTLTPTAIIIFGTEHSGRLSFDVNELELLRNEPWIVKISLDINNGDYVQPFINGRHRIGDALVRGDDRFGLDERVRETRRRLNVRAT